MHSNIKDKALCFHSWLQQPPLPPPSQGAGGGLSAAPLHPVLVIRKHNRGDKCGHFLSRWWEGGSGQRFCSPERWPGKSVSPACSAFSLFLLPVHILAACLRLWVWLGWFICRLWYLLLFNPLFLSLSLWVIESL